MIQREREKEKYIKKKIFKEKEKDINFNILSITEKRNIEREKREYYQRDNYFIFILFFINTEKKSNQTNQP